MTWLKISLKKEREIQIENFKAPILIFLANYTLVVGKFGPFSRVFCHYLVPFWTHVGPVLLQLMLVPFCYNFGLFDLTLVSNFSITNSNWPYFAVLLTFWVK